MRAVLLATMVVVLGLCAGCSEPDAETMKTPPPGESKNAPVFGVGQKQGGQGQSMKRSLGRGPAGG
ncbi:MAG: hypothetical protein KF857_11670 [Fimbriimonadaceae bacterium]|nr:hypothetical protein [Fimbriimonadaceae bacterium]